MNRVIALVQARMGSTRFPGKMLEDLAGHPVLEWVLRRTSQARLIDQVVLATTDLNRDDPLVVLAQKLGFEVFRGSESDVLGRFSEAANQYKAKAIVRICADNPFICASELDRLVMYYTDNSCDYVCNHQDRLGSAYADGFGAEILSNQLLQQLASSVTDDRHREHVTLSLWESPDCYSLLAIPAPAQLAFPELRFDVDVPQDMNYLRQLTCHGIGFESSAAEIVALARRLRLCPAGDFANEISKEIDLYLKRLFPICRSIMGEPNRQTLSILQDIVPLTIHEVPSGTRVYDWVIPEEWSIRNAWIEDCDGRRIVDFASNNLHVVGYSVPVNASLDWAELESHIHRHPSLPDAIPYRTSYYKRDWGFCVTHKQYEELAKANGRLNVLIDSELKHGSLTYGEYLIPGVSSQEILLSCYICHPSMANDSLSGVLLTAFLARHIANLADRHWSYRVVFVPETIGAIAYCFSNEAAMKKIDTGLVITTVGGPGPFGYKQSFEASHPINNMIEEVFWEANKEFVKYPFDIHGSDERQYSSPGFRINTATICRDRYYEYAYYHSSLDDLDYVNGRQIAETLELYIRLIDKLEARQIYRNTIQYGEVMLSRHGLYPAMGGGMLPADLGRSELDLILWLLFLCDGRHDLEQIASLLETPIDKVASLVDRLVKGGVLESL